MEIEKLQTTILSIPFMGYFFIRKIKKLRKITFNSLYGIHDKLFRFNKKYS